MPIDPRIALSGQPFQVPKFDLGETYTTIARIQAMEEQRRGQAILNKGNERALGREEAWDAQMAQVFTPSPQAPPQGSAAPPAPPQTQGLTAPPPQGPPQGQYGLMAPPQGMPQSFQRAPATMPPPPMLQGAMPQGLTAQGPPPPQGITAQEPQARKPGPFAQLAQPLNMEALQQAFAIDPEKTSRWVSQHTQMQAQKLAQAKQMTSAMYHVGKRILASDNQQQAYEIGMQQLRDQGIPLPKDLPPTYNPAWMAYTVDSLRTHDVELDELKVQQEQQKLQLATFQAQTGRLQAMNEGAKLAQAPKVDYGYGPEMDAALDARFGDAIRQSGRPPTQAMVAQATQDVDARHVGRNVETFRQTAPERADIARQTGAAAQGEKPLEGPERIRINGMTQAEDIARQLAAEFTPEERKRFVGLGGLKKRGQELQQLLADAGQGKADPKYARFAALTAMARAESLSEGGKNFTATEKDLLYGYVTSGEELSTEMFEQKLTLAQQRLPAMLDRELKLSTTPRRELPGMRARGEMSGQAQLNPSAGRPVGEMSDQELEAERAALRGQR